MPPNRMGTSGIISREAPIRVRFASQVAVDPPKFLFHVNDLKLLHFSYERYLENQLRAAHPFIGTPIRLSFRRSGKAWSER